MPSDLARVFLSIGSNLGDRLDNLHRAIEMLIDGGLEIKRVSSFYETRPWGLSGQPNFLNGAVEAQTSLMPMELLNLLKDIEVRLGRTDTVRWGPRCIDIDIIFYDDQKIAEEGLQVPHPLMHKRGFVLRPLAEIAPQFVHPVFKKDIKTLLEDLDEDDQC
jgi:2-amino-4-hydroxy-6-hydroxymethyldihydropteridine diphosphokinase